MNLKTLPFESMPREKLMAHGAKSLTDAELLAIFLRTGTREMNVLKLSDSLIKNFGSLNHILYATKEEFCSHKGLGEAKYVQIQAVTEMASRYLSEQLKQGDLLSSSKVTKQYLLSLLRGHHREVFYVLYLDNQNRLIHDEALFEGTINSASVYPREVVKQALYHNAVSVILAHNHPSGLIKVSQSDKEITRQLIDALILVDIKVLDHLIVGDGEVLSFAESGLI